MEVRVVHDDGVAQLIFDHPPVNSFDAAFLEAVHDAVGALPEDTLALVVGSAVEGIFAAGGDIPWMARAPMDELLPFVALCQETYSAFERLEIPTVAAIEGACLGGGLELCLSCDIRVASESSALGLPEATIGLIAGAGGTQRLVRAIGQGIARDLLLTGRRVSGVEAGAMGIVSRVVPDGDALPAAIDVARRLADGPAAAIRATKRLAVAAPDLSIADGLAREREEWEQVRSSPSSQEGLDAFAEKRRPNFRGKR
jgi:enoyl-CoA hydratase/carnithine racemase